MGSPPFVFSFLLRLYCRVVHEAEGVDSNSCPLLRKEVATKANPSKGGDAKQRSYSGGKSVTRLAELPNTTGGVNNVVVDP